MPYGLNLGSLSNALRLTGGDPDLAERLLREEREPRPPIAPVNDLPGISRGLPENPYAEPAPNPFKRDGALPDDGAMRDFEPERVVARPKEQRSIYDSPEIQAALEKVGMAPKTYGGSAPNGELPANPYADEPMPVQESRSQFASLGSQDDAAQRLAMRAPGSAPIDDPRRAPPPPTPPGAAPVPPEQQQALRRTQPAPVQLPQGTQQALQATGSQYQVPQLDMLRNGASVRDLRGTQVDDANARIAAHGYLGDVKEAGELRSAQIQNAQTQELDARAAHNAERGQAVEQRTDQNRSHAMQLLDTAQKKLAEGPPGEQRPGLRIAGTIMSFIPGLSGIGRGMYNLAKSKDAEAQGEWATKVGAAKEGIKLDQDMNASEHDDRKNELAESHMDDIATGLRTVSQLEAVARVTNSQQVKVDSLDKVAAIKTQLADKMMGWKAQETKAAGAGSRNAEDTNILKALASVPDAQRPDLAMKMGPRALELLGKSQKNTTNVVGMGKDLAQTEATQAEAARKATEQAAGPKLSDGDKKLQRLAEGVRPAYNSLSKYAEKIGKGEAAVPYVGVGPGATTMFAGEETQGLNGNIQQLANVLLRDESGANLPESEQKTKWDAWGITSPDEAVRNKGLGKMLAEYEGRVSHVAPVTGQPAQAAPKPAATPGYSREEIEAELRRRRAQAGR